MRITHNTEPKAFRPISLTITIENQEELDVLEFMAALDVTLPATVASQYRANPIAASIVVEDFLVSLQAALKEAQK